MELASNLHCNDLESEYEANKKNVEKIKSDLFRRKKSHNIPLPAPWEKHYSDEFGSHYYFNTDTGESSWDFPVDSHVTQEATKLTIVCDREDDDSHYGVESHQSNFSVSFNEHQQQHQLHSSNAETIQKPDKQITLTRPQSLSVVSRSVDMLRNKHLKEEAIRHRLEEKRQQEQQAGPTITHTGKSVQRNVGDMLAWEQTRRAKLQSLAAERRKLEDAEMTGRPVITKAAERVSQKWQNEQQNDADGVPCDELFRPQVKSKPVEERLLEYEELRRAKLQHAVQQQEDNIRRMAVPVVAPHSTALERTGDVVDRLYGLATAQYHARETQDAFVAHTMQHDRETGQKLFQPRLNANSERMVNRTRPSVPVEVLLNHRGQQQQAKLLEKGRRIDSRAQQLRESAARMNPVSERLAARKMAKEGIDSSTPAEVRLSGKGIGHVKASTLQGIQEPTFKPTISKGSRSILAASHSHQATSSGGIEPVQYRRFVASSYESTPMRRDQWREEGDEEEEEETGPYVDERMVYGERQSWEEEEAQDSPSDYDNRPPENWYSDFRSDPAAPLSDDRLFDPTQHSLSSHHGTTMMGSFAKSSGGHSVYSRSKQWDEERQRKRERDRLRKEQEELAECSFRPRGGARSETDSSLLTGSVSERQAAWAVKREIKLELERQRVLEEEMRDCSFAPSRSSHKANANAVQSVKAVPDWTTSLLPPPPPPPFMSNDQQQESATRRVPLPVRSLGAAPIIVPSREAYHYHGGREHPAGGGIGRIPVPMLPSRRSELSAGDQLDWPSNHVDAADRITAGPVPVPLPSTHAPTNPTLSGAPARPLTGAPLVLRELEDEEEEEEDDKYNRHNFNHHQQNNYYDLSGGFEDNLHCLELDDEEEGDDKTDWRVSASHQCHEKQPSSTNSSGHHCKQHRAPPPIPLPIKSFR